MGGYFAAALNEDCVFDVYFGTDYHSHLGTRRGGMVVYGENGFERAIHNIESTPFRAKFDGDLRKMKGNMGMGCISDYEPQPVTVRSHHGTFSITTVGKINNKEDLINHIFNHSGSQFMEMSGGEINTTELVAALINEKENIVEGIQHAQSLIEGSMSMMILTPVGIYLARDKMGRTPIQIGKRDTGFCASFESFAFLNIGYKKFRELGPGEIAVMTADQVVTLVKPGTDMKICTFLWVYYGFPASSYEGISVEKMRYDCGANLAARDTLTADDFDIVAGVPESGVAHAIGYSNQAQKPYTRPFIKYTPTWARSFMPTLQSRREVVARMKLVPEPDQIAGKRMVLIDDSIVRGTQLREKVDILYEAGAKEVHIRPACPPILFGCKYLNFSRSKSEMELIARRIIDQLEGRHLENDELSEYADPDSPKYEAMVEGIRQQQGYDSLRYNRLDDMLAACGIPADKLCTYCWNGEE